MKKIEIIASTNAGKGLTNNPNVLVAEKENDPLYFYGTITENKGNKTITRRIVYAGVLSSPGTIRIGKASCSPKDRFVKAKGKAIALGRAKSKQPEEVLYLTDDTTPVKQFINRVSKLVDQPILNS